MLNPKKGQSEWAPGYVVLTVHSNGGMLVLSPDNVEIRVNRDRVRKTTDQRPYEEIDPL